MARNIYCGDRDSIDVSQNNNISSNDVELDVLKTSYRNVGMVSNTWGINVPSSHSMLKNTAGSISVYNNDSYCGITNATCTWTVPAGINIAEFQVWGAGGSSVSCNNTSYCSYGAGGDNGEYTYAVASVTPGDTFCLIAGGAYPCGGCHSYFNCNGSGSSVHNDGSTSNCLKLCSCGGVSCYSKMGLQGYCNYHTAFNPYANSQNSNGTFTSTGNDGCMGLHFTRPQFYNGGSADTLGTSVDCAGNITAYAKVPRMIGGFLYCNTSSTYGFWRQVHVDENNDIRLIEASICTGGGCCLDACSLYNKPGLGGPAPIQSSNSQGPIWGGRGRSGKVIVNYK